MTGNFRATMLLFSSKLFNAELFALCIDKREVMVMQNRATVVGSLFQDLPQLIVSVVYAAHTAKFVIDIVLFTTVFGWLHHCVGSVVEDEAPHPCH